MKGSDTELLHDNDSNENPPSPQQPSQRQSIDDNQSHAEDKISADDLDEVIEL